MISMRRYLYIAVFFSGMASLAVEFSASRLLGNYFGSSNLVWASIVGLILIYLTAGYFLGGHWADRSPHYSTLFKILCWAGLTTGLVSIVSRPVLRMAANAFDQLQLGVLFGSFTVVMILFVIPVTLMGTASPFAIRLAIEDPSAAGKVSGRIYAISTLGSFIGTFLPVLVLIPNVGTYRTFLIISFILILVALIGLVMAQGIRKSVPYFGMPILIVLLAIFGIPGNDKNSIGQVYEKESAYNYIQVLDQDGYMLLRLNEGQGVHSIYKPGQYNFNGPWERVLTAPFFNDSPYPRSEVENIAILGLAAGTTAVESARVFPNVTIDGYEIDPEIVKVGYQYFGMDLPNLNVVIQDARWGLAHSTQQYDVISVDAYRPPYIPWQMTTVEFFQMVKEHLKPNGVMVINVGTAPSDRRLLASLYKTIGEVFPSLYVSDVAGSFNSVIYATNQKTSIQGLMENYQVLNADPSTPDFLLQILAETYAGMQPAPTGGVIFTDDKAPIEQLTNSMVLNFLLSGQVEKLQ
jgi:predicted membrane-bound spermidine synthase